MARHWNANWGSHRREPRDPWQPRENGAEYGWLKRTAAAAVIFALVYVAQASDTTVGRAVSDAVRYTLTTETDFAYLADKIAGYAPNNMDVSVFRRLSGNVTKPADPLLYMTKPVDGKVVSRFGWQVHPVLKQEVLQEGVELDAPLGAPVRASAAGRVKAVADSARHGRVLVVEHSKDIDTLYGHLGEVLVKEGEAVSQGQVVARVGKTGMTAAPLLYFEVREKGVAVDPLPRLTEGK
ncbi:MAG TPA: peptidoglycan DD-metalloendopeptidase family protein [Negativicutes bacterium]|nr:peptidoglycan DD-metalloendopeptidase family protein [Negativicutes bacterium]